MKLKLGLLRQQISQALVEGQGRPTDLPKKLLKALEARPKSITQLKDELRVNNGDTLKYHLKKLEAAGKVVLLGAMPSGKQGQSSSAVYGLPGQTLDTADIVKTTDEKILDVLKERGPQLVQDIVELVKVSRDSIYDALAKLQGEGKVVPLEKEVEFYAKTKGEVRKFWALPSHTLEDIKLPDDDTGAEPSTAEQVRQWLLSYLRQNGPQQFSQIVENYPNIPDVTEHSVRFAIDKCKQEGQIVPLRYTPEELNRTRSRQWKLKHGSRVYWALPDQTLPPLGINPQRKKIVRDKKPLSDVEQLIVRYLKNVRYDIPEASMFADLEVKFPVRRLQTALKTLKEKGLVKLTQRSRSGRKDGVRNYWSLSEEAAESR